MAVVVVCAGQQCTVAVWSDKQAQDCAAAANVACARLKEVGGEAGQLLCRCQIFSSSPQQRTIHFLLDLNGGYIAAAELHAEAL